MVKKTYIKSSDNKEEANIWRKGLRGCKQREKKKKEKTNKNTERACVTKCQTHTLFPRSFNQTKCGNSTLTWRILQPSWTCPWYSSVNSTVSGNLLLFVPLYQLRNILSFALKSRTQPDSTAKWNWCCFIISPTAFQPSLLALFSLDRINLGYCYWC